MSNYDEMAGRIMAHAFYDEMEKISGIGDMITGAVGEAGKSALRSAADKLVGRPAREAAERTYSSTVKNLDALKPGATGIAQTVERLGANQIGPGGSKKIRLAGADVEGRVRRILKSPGTVTEKARDARAVAQTIPGETLRQRAAAVANAAQRLTTKQKPPKNKGRRK